MSRILSYELPLPVLGEAGAGGDHGDVVRAHNVQVQCPEACLLCARQLKLVKNRVNTSLKTEVLESWNWKIVYY